MKKYLPLLLAMAGLTAALGVLFLLVRLDALPMGVRALDWRKPGGTAPSEPFEDQAA